MFGANNKHDWKRLKATQKTLNKWIKPKLFTTYDLQEMKTNDNHQQSLSLIIISVNSVTYTQLHANGIRQTGTRFA